jgi:outer membrane protein
MCFRQFLQTISLILIITITAGKASFADGPETLSLQQCIDLAWKNNLQLKQQKLAVDMAGQNLSQAKASSFPSFNASASHGYNYGRTIDPFTNEFATERVQSNNFSISSGMNLFSGFQVRNSIKQSQYELEAGRFDLDRSYNDVALLVASAYLQILFAMELVENVRNQIAITQLQLERTNRLVEAGTLPRGAMLTIQAQRPKSIRPFIPEYPANHVLARRL